MLESELLPLALHNLEKNTQIKWKWNETPKMETDGELELKIERQTITINVEVKKELRNYHLIDLLQKNEHYGPLMVVAQKIFPKLKQELRQKDIAYLEANGNAWIKKDGLYIFIDTNKVLETEKEKPNRAFTKTGLKVVFDFLLDERLINMPYREIAERTNTGLGNVNNIMNGLKEQGFLIKKNRHEKKMINKKKLLEKWLVDYDEKLKPSLNMGTYRFADREKFDNWKELLINSGETYWGGEPAGDLYTDYLRPAILTLYTLETRNELIKNYRLVPDTKGNVKVYKKFWRHDDGYSKAVPPLLAYADLMNTDDNRCRETAIKIYEQFLQDKFK